MKTKIVDSKQEIAQQLRESIERIKPDLKKFNGDPSVALAERLIKIIELCTPFADLFDDNAKVQIKNYIETYEKTREGKPTNENIFTLIKPCQDTIQKVLKNLAGVGKGIWKEDAQDYVNKLRTGQDV